jgi:hypothetical protein
MLNKLMTVTMLAVSLTMSQLHADIIETHEVESILPYVDQDTLVLFNIANVLTDSEISLGSSQWRAYVKTQAKKIQNPEFNIHDVLTWQAFSLVPHKSVEAVTPSLIENLQNQDIAVAALTSRGRTEWYNTSVPTVDQHTEKMLHSIDIDFRQSNLPFVFAQYEGNPFLDHYRGGIFYSNHMSKGEFLKQLLQDSGYMPKAVVFIDDKIDSLDDVEAAMQELGIPFHGFWYTRATDRTGFSPMVANVQLEALLKDQQILSDEEAKVIADTKYADVDPDDLFRELLNEIVHINK